MNIPQLFTTPKVKISSRVIVHNMPFAAYVAAIEEDAGEKVFVLDWKEHGHSLVREHDYGEVWKLYTEIN